MLEDREQELQNSSYNPRLPIDVVFNTVAKAYIIINKTRHFKTAITEWNRHPKADKK